MAKIKKDYILAFGPEGAKFVNLKKLQSFIYCESAYETRKFFSQSLNYRDDSGAITLFWLIPYVKINKFKIDGGIDVTYDFDKFFKSLRFRSNKKESNYIHSKISGFCDLRAPIRNNGLLKKWYDKFYGKQEPKDNSRRIS